MAHKITAVQHNRPRSKIKSLNTSSLIAVLSRKHWKSLETSCFSVFIHYVFQHYAV